MVALDERQAEQARLHAADPYHVPKFLPVDDPEFGTEAWTAAWDEDGEPPEPKHARNGPTSAQRLRPRIGPVMRELRDVVSCRPGISGWQAIEATGRDYQWRGNAYRPLHRALAAGLVIKRDRPGRWQLFATTRDMELYDLRQRLMSASSADEAGQLRAAIEEIQAEQAATWTA